MANLLPPSSTKLERNLAAAMAPLGALPAPLRDLMNADKIAASALPWLAWHFGLTAWKDYWPEQVKRAYVKSAIPVARKNGTAAAVREVVAAFGANIAIREWFELTPPGIPGTFDVVLTISAREGLPATAEFVADVVAEIDRTKPVRAHYTFTQGFDAQGGVAAAGAFRVAAYQRLSFTDN